MEIYPKVVSHYILIEDSSFFLLWEIMMNGGMVGLPW
jgi:hypothetical protein